MRLAGLFFFLLYLYFFALTVLALTFVLCCKTHTTQTSMPPAGFEPAILASDRPQILALDRSATGTGRCIVFWHETHRDTANVEQKCMVIPAATGVTETVTKGLKKNLQVTPGKHSTDSLQNTAVLGTSHTMLKVLQSETWSVSDGDYRWLKRRSTGEKRTVRGDVIIIIIIIINNLRAFRKSFSSQN